MANMTLLGTYDKGSAPKIYATASKVSTSGTISVWDGEGNLMVDEEAMTKDSSLIYSYIFQTDSTWVEGNCVVKTTVITSEFSDVKEDYIKLNKLSY